MAIVFVTVIGLLLAAALSYGAVSMKAASTKYKPARERLYAADAATKAAVLFVGADPSAGQSLPGTTCKTAANYGTVGGKSVDIQVCPQGTGATGSFPTPGSTRWGLVTLATGATNGVSVTGANPFQINGNVYSNSSIAAGTGSLVVRQGSLYATSCTGTVTVDGLKDCAATGKGTANNPGYLPGIVDAPADATVASACPTTGSAGSRVVQINPGKWTAAILTAAQGCANVWLKPGVHYLEGLGSWSITKKVVAGTLPASGASGISGTAIPGGCDDTGAGAMLFLAGDTTISVGTGGSLQVCGQAVTQASGRSVKLPLYDTIADISVTTADTLASTTTATTVDDGCATGSDPCWSSPSKATTVNGQVAQSNSLIKNQSTSNLTIKGFTTSTGVDIPSPLRTLTVDVTATSTLIGTGNAAATYTVKVLNSDDTVACTSASQTIAVGSSLPATPDEFTVPCTKALVPPLSVRFQATTSSNAGTRVVKLDGITLAFSYTTPATLKAHTAATSLTATTSSAPVWFGGEIYTPASALSLRATALNGALSTLGAVVKSLTVNTDNATADVVGSANNVYTGDGDVVVKTRVGGTDWVTCRVTYVLSGTTGTPTLKGCTVPR